MSLAELTPQEASQRLLSFLKEDRLIQGAWHKTNGGGRQLACMIGALDPSINDASQCPSGVMPRWLAELTVSLFDGQEKSAALNWAERYAGLMARWHVLDVDAWGRIERRFKIATVRFAIEAAEPVAKDKDYWPAITKAAQQVCDALESNDAAAYAAADAAARAAAYAAASAAADAAADAAASAAAYAAADAAARAAARAAAYAAAYAALASKLLDGIELEVLSAESLAGAV